MGFVGSSNLTLVGLSKQGELNVDVMEQDAANKFVIGLMIVGMINGALIFLMN